MGYESDVRNELHHYGILGQKWGVRRAEAELGRARTSTDEGSEDHKLTRTLQKRGSKNLSTKELRDLTQRLQLEKQFDDLNQNSFSKGMKFANKVLKTGTTIASIYALTKTPLGQDIKKALS